MDGIPISTILICIILTLCIACAAVFLIRRDHSRKKVLMMCMSDKIRLLNELAKPFGFSYHQEEDVFIGRIDAWQRAAGYESLFDRAAAHLHMVIDTWPVYFDYEGRTWLLELWKGQYGISTGAEIGIYHANRIVPKEARKHTHFEAAEDIEMPLISLDLEKNDKRLFALKQRHWWLAAFLVGTFSRPKDLKLAATITFESPQQAEAFLTGLAESGRSSEYCRKNCNEVYVRMDFTEQYSWLRKIYCKWVQWQNRICCRLYLWITHPFHRTPDRILFLYFQLPRCFRRLMRRPIRQKDCR